MKYIWFGWNALLQKSPANGRKGAHQFGKLLLHWFSKALTLAGIQGTWIYTHPLNMHLFSEKEPCLPLPP